MSDFPALPDFSLIETDRERFLERIEEVREDLIERLADILDTNKNPYDLSEALTPLLEFYNKENPEFEVSPWIRVEIVEDQLLFEAFVAFEDEEDDVYDDALLERLEGAVWWFVDEDPPLDPGAELVDERREIHEHVAYHLLALFAWGAEDVEW
jgi:hypothetical protein